MLGGGKAKVRFASLTVVLFLFWLALSGQFTTMLLGIGLVTSILVALAASRLKIADDEGHPVHLLIGAITYWPWLVKAIAVSPFTVAKVVLNPSLPMSPTTTVVSASQRTTAGSATYANSITLTPGTVTTGVNGNELTVHALQRAGADDLEAGGMDARVLRFEEGR